MKYKMTDYLGAACFIVILGVVKPIANGALLIREKFKRKKGANHVLSKKEKHSST